MSFLSKSSWRRIAQPKRGGTGQIHPGAPYRRVLLVNPPMEAMGAEFMMEDVPIRLEYLAAFIRQHVEQVEVIDLTRDSRPLEHFLVRQRPDLVGITINYTSTHKSALELARVAKRFGADVVVGGYHATALAATFAASPDIDCVVRGEGEATLLELLQNKPHHEILGITYRHHGEVRSTRDRPLIADLDSIPFPERDRRKTPYRAPFMDLESDGATGYDMIITSRGCWGKCTFCTEPIMSHGTQRYRRPEKVIQELDEIVRIHPGKKRLRVSISDPNFGGNPKLAEELCEQLIAFRARCKTDLHFFVSVRTGTIANHPRLARKMVQAGIDYVFVGMESPRQDELKALSKLGGSREQQERASKFLKDNGAAVMSNFLLGLPGQTEDDILALVDYAKNLELADCYFSIMTPLPGSKLYDDAKKSGQLLEEDFTKYRLWDMVLKHDTLSRSQIRELCIRCNAKWYDDLLLKPEYRRWLMSGKKKKLHVYAGKFKVLIDFFSFWSRNTAEALSDFKPSVFVKDMPNPELKRFTLEKGVHNILDMGRFLQILGSQKIQVSLKLNSEETVSWVAKTTPSTVEYVDAIRGKAADATISINVPLDDGKITVKRVVAGILRDNKDARARINLFRLVAATGVEILNSYLDKAAVARWGAVHALWQRVFPAPPSPPAPRRLNPIEGRTRAALAPVSPAPEPLRTPDHARSTTVGEVTYTSAGTVSGGPGGGG